MGDAAGPDRLLDRLTGRVAHRAPVDLLRGRAREAVGAARERRRRGCGRSCSATAPSGSARPAAGRAAARSGGRRSRAAGRAGGAPAPAAQPLVAIAHAAILARRDARGFHHTAELDPGSGGQAVPVSWRSASRPRAPALYVHGVPNGSGVARRSSCARAARRSTSPASATPSRRRPSPSGSRATTATSSVSSTGGGSTASTW